MLTVLPVGVAMAKRGRKPIFENKRTTCITALDPEELITLVFTFVIIGMIAGNILGYLITKMFSKKVN